VTLRRPLLLLILAAMLPLVVLSAALGAFFLREQSANIEEQALFRVRQLATVISRDLTAQLDLLLIIAQSREFDGALDVDALRGTLERIQRHHSTWRALRVTNPEGQVLIDVPSVIAQGQLVDETSHRQIIEQRQPVVGRVLRGPEGTAAFAIRAPVIRDGEIKYVVSAVVTPDEITRLLAGVHLDPEWIGTVIDGEGYVMARTTEPAFVGERASARALDARRASGEGIYEGFTLERTQTMSVFSRVGMAGWSVHIGVPAAIFRASQNQTLLLVVSAGVTALILVGLFLWLLQRELKRQREAERALRQTQADLARLTTMGQLTASIAQEVKQPIGATVNNALAALRFLDSRPPDLGEVRQALADIVKAGSLAGDVTDRIRDLIKRAPLRKDRLEINGAIREVIELTRGEAVKNGVSVRTELAGALPLIEGDRVELQQVILNLIINAIEAMSGTSDGSRELIISTGKAESGGVLVAVRDSGPGLAPATLEHIFGAFYTTKPNGMGMGLSISHSIIKAHGGRLWAEANVPHGAIFQFTLVPVVN
jgi:signal transduction histidine kinase